VFRRARKRGAIKKRPPTGAASYRAKSLEPASPAIPTTAADKQHYDDDDQKRCRVHIVLLKARVLYLASFSSRGEVVHAPSLQN
jgi:hypothetical protein